MLKQNLSRLEQNRIAFQESKRKEFKVSNKAEEKGQQFTIMMAQQRAALEKKQRELELKAQQQKQKRDEELER